MNITLNYTSLYETVGRSLSVIGKRSTDDKGNLLFRDITLGTNEQPIVEDYFRQAAIDIASKTAGFISGSTDDTIILELPTNHNSALESFIQKSCDAYCVSFALYSWFTVTAPRIAQLYADDCKRQMDAVVRMIHEKKAPEVPQNSESQDISPLSITTTITSNT